MLNKSTTPGEIEDLKLYMERVKAIKSSGFVAFLNRNKKISFDLNFKKGLGVHFSGEWPNEELIKAFMMDFSQIYLSKDQPANFKHIYNILYTRLTNEKQKQKVAKCRELYNKSLKIRPALLTYNNQELTPEKILKHWIQGAYRHDNREFRRVIKDWEDNSGGYYKFAFLDIITDLLYPIIILSNIAEKAL